MGLFRDLFERAVTLRDLKTALLRVERERRKKQAEMRKQSAQQASLIEQAKQARRDGGDLELDYLWEEMAQVRTDLGLIRRELKILNLEGIGLKRYVRGMERLERERNPKAVKQLIERVRHSSLDAKLGVANLREQEYLAELNEILADVGVELEEAEAVAADPGKAKFVADLDAILHAEHAGKPDEAAERTQALRTRLEREAEKGEA